jgi:hypothetical protein
MTTTGLRNTQYEPFQFTKIKLPGNEYFWSHPFKSEESITKDEIHEDFPHDLKGLEHDDIFFKKAEYANWGGVLGNDHRREDAAYVVWQVDKINVDVNSKRRGTYRRRRYYFKVPTLDIPMEEMDTEGQDVYFAWCQFTKEWPCEVTGIPKRRRKPSVNVKFLDFDKLGIDGKAEMIHGSDGVEETIDLNLNPYLWKPYNKFRKEKQLPKLFCICNKKYKEGEWMFRCDSCHNWFHSHCSNRSEKEVNGEDMVFCNGCSGGSRSYPIYC